MTAPTKEQRLAKIHQEALLQFDRIQKAVQEERKQCLEDRRFYSIAGAQWEGDLSEQFENKPKFEVNKVHLSVLRIENEYLNNRITVDFVSKDGTENDKLADACDGLYRADEQDSSAEEATDNAFKEAVGGGMGAWRYRAVYEDEEDPENDHQRIRIEPIYDADSCVFFDLGSKRQDKADAKHCFVLCSYTPEDYKDEFGDDPSTWPKEISSAQFDWASPDVVYVAEYYRVEEKRDTMVVFEAPTGEEKKYHQSELDEDESILPTLEATGCKEIRRKKFKSRKIHKYIMSGGKVLEDCGIIAGKHIPIVQSFGQRWFVDGVERCMGHVRLQKDVQRLKNMQLSKLGELSAYSSVEKPILTPEQIAGHQVMWSEDNIKDYPYLLINPITDQNGQPMPAGPVAYTKPPQIPPAMAALLQITEQDMQELAGNPANAEKMISNIGEKTVEMIHARLDMQTFIYMSNHAKAVKRGGAIWLSMMKDLAVEPGRKMKTIGPHGEKGTIELLRPMKNQETGKDDLENDFSKANLDVSVEVGPSSASRRDATVRKLTNMLAATTDPDTQQVLQSLIMANMEGEGLSEVRPYFRMKLVKMGVLKPTDEEAKELATAQASQGEDPQVTYLKAAADQASADATQSRVKTLDTMASAELKRAQTAETLASIDQKERQQVIDMAGKVIQPHDTRPFNPQAAAQQDVVHADLSIPEARHLVADGGAGKINPATGRMSFYNERGDGTDGNQGAGNNDAGGAEGDGSGGVGGNGAGSGGRSRQGDYNSTPGAVQAGRDAAYHDVNADRAGRFAPEGSVDPNAVAEGKAYGIDAQRAHSFNDFKTGWKIGGYVGKVTGTGTLASLGGGLVGLGIGHEVSPQVNGGGWQGLGGSGQVASTTGESPGQIGQGERGGVQAPSQQPVQQSQVASYEPRVPVEAWSKLPWQQRQAAIQEYWSRF